MKHARGFTIVELLIVIVVIAILAAISIVAYTGIQNQANDVAVMSDLKNISTNLEMHRAEGGGGYPYAATRNDLYVQLATLNISPTITAYNTTDNSNFLYFTNQNGQEYALVAKSKSGTIFYVSSRQTAVTTYDGNFPGPGASAIRRALLPPAAQTINPNEIVWGYGASGWAPQWIQQD